MDTDATQDYQRFLRHLGRKLQAARKSQGLSQEAMSERLGVSRVYLGYIEQSRKVPNLELLYNIASVLGVEVTAFFDGVKIGKPTRGIGNLDTETHATGQESQI